jgi:hypothetical protein
MAAISGRLSWVSHAIEILKATDARFPAPGQLPALSPRFHLKCTNANILMAKANHLLATGSC